MFFKNFSESATLLAQKIKAEEFVSFQLFFLNPDSEDFASKVAQELNASTTLLSNPQQLDKETRHIIIIDRGDTLAQEYNEFTDIIRKNNPSINITLAIPTIPTSEEHLFKQSCDTLIYLHSEPNFFSINQFYQEYW